MRRCLPHLTLALAACCLAACTSTVAGNGSPGEPDATASVTNNFPDAATPVAVPDAAPVVQPCIEGDKQVTNPVDDTCYMLLNTPTSWTGAQASCLGLGANLVSIETVEEQTIVASLAAEFPPGTPDLWLGASDALLEGSFVWIDQSPVAYSNWRAGEPNDNGPNGTGEDCATIEGDNLAFEWDDRACSQLYPAICER